MSRPPTRLLPLLARHLWLAFLPVLAAVALLTACGGSSSSSGKAAGGSAHALTGADVYQMSCARCHGADRQGVNGAPKLDSVRIATNGDTALRMLVMYGKGRMPAFGGLSPTQVDLLVAYLKGS